MLAAHQEQLENSWPWLWPAKVTELIKSGYERFVDPDLVIPGLKTKCFSAKIGAQASKRCTLPARTPKEVEGEVIGN